MASGDLIFTTSYLGCLAQGSFLVGHDGWAFVIDPRRDVDEYLAVRVLQKLLLDPILFLVELVMAARCLRACVAPNLRRSFIFKQFVVAFVVAVGATGTGPPEPAAQRRPAHAPARGLRTSVVA